jgi:hypothetical protein
VIFVIPCIPFVDKKPFPAGDRIRANDGMDRDKIQALVVWGSAVRSKGFSESLANDFEMCCIMDGAESFEECLVLRTDAVISLVSALPKELVPVRIWGLSERRYGPQSVASRFSGQSMDLENGVIAGSLFKGDASRSER